MPWKAPKYRAWFALAALIVLLALGAGGFGLYDRFTVGDQNRRANADAWHSVVCYLEQQIAAAPRMTRAEKAAALRVYDHILSLVQAQPCLKGVADVG